MRRRSAALVVRRSGAALMLRRWREAARWEMGVAGQARAMAMARGHGRRKLRRRGEKERTGVH